MATARRHLAVSGSIAIHAAVGLLLVAIRSHEPLPVETRSSIEVVDVDPASVVELVQIETGGGGTQGRDGRGHASTDPASTDASSTRSSTSATISSTRSSTRATISSRSRDWIAKVDRRSPARPTERSLTDSLGELATSSRDDASHDATSSHDAGSSGGDGGDGGGRGGGHGRGIGRGVGRGLGELASAGDQLPAPPPAPKASKARPAKLIYPTREGAVVDGLVYVAHVKIDAEGFVVGARLTQRMGGTKDEDAASLIFRFRYAPALDDDGRPIRSELDQPFLVGP